ncbi:MAG: ABC transporter ATP-binding protein [Thiobacillaceae bacterium]|jgi:putative ABC transport system ATP-binding protein
MIRLSEIQRIFHMGDQEVRALDGISLDIAAGEYVSIQGSSGSGKSTLLNVIGLLDHPDSGRYELEGRDVTNLTEQERAQVRQKKVGFVFQSFHLVPRLTARENIELPLMLAGVTPTERHSRVAEVLEDYGLLDRASHRPAELSGGQRQRVAIARATVMDPAVLLADEPTGNLDHTTGREVIALLEKLNGMGTLLILVTHDPELGERARRKIHMRDGHIIGDEHS